MKNTFNTLALVIGVFLVGTMVVNAQVVSSDASSDIAQDAAAAVVVVVTPTPSADADQDVAAGITSSPSTDLAQDGAAGITSSPSTDLDQDGPVVTPPTDNGGNGGNGGNNNGGGGSVAQTGSTSGSSSGGSFVGINPMVLGAFTTSTTSCPLITDYLKLGGANNPIQVTKLQVFLKVSEGADLTVSGIFDQKTDAAVKNFQKKYMADILGPWDATRSTGFVYITTMKKLNQLACASPITLSDNDRAIIAAYKARGATDQAAETITSSDDSSNVGATPTDGAGETDADNTAATADASILTRFWSFIKSLFK